MLITHTCVDQCVITSEHTSHLLQTNRATLYVILLCCKHRWTLTVINWRRSSVELS